MSHCLTDMLKLSKRFLKDESAVSAVEFALISPFMLGTYFAFVGLAAGNQTANRVSQVASTVSDIISQSAGLSAVQVDLALKAGEAIAGANNASAMTIEVIGVLVDSRGRTKVQWSRDSTGGRPYAKNSAYQLPSSLLSQPGFVVASRTSYGYKPEFGKTFVPQDGVQLNYQSFYVPRTSGEVFCNDC